MNTSAMEIAKLRFSKPSRLLVMLRNRLLNLPNTRTTSRARVMLIQIKMNLRKLRNHTVENPARPRRNFVLMSRKQSVRAQLLRKLQLCQMKIPSPGFTPSLKLNLSNPWWFLQVLAGAKQLKLGINLRRRENFCLLSVCLNFVAGVLLKKVVITTLGPVETVSQILLLA